MQIVHRHAAVDEVRGGQRDQSGGEKAIRSSFEDPDAENVREDDVAGGKERGRQPPISGIWKYSGRNRPFASCAVCAIDAACSANCTSASCR
jgi:hypothetical protein